MSRVFVSIAVVFLILTAPTSAQAAPFEDGVLAFDQGRYAEAKALFEGLDEFGHAGAEAMLGIMYFNGQGVEKDRYIAAIYFYKGARRGNANAQLALGSLYIQGIGVRASATTAYKWISLAERSAQGALAEAARQLKAELATGLSATERDKVDATVAQWKPVRINN